MVITVSVLPRILSPSLVISFLYLNVLFSRSVSFIFALEATTSFSRAVPSKFNDLVINDYPFGTARNKCPNPRSRLYFL